jgi:hypothetical protein
VATLRSLVWNNYWSNSPDLRLSNDFIFAPPNYSGTLTVFNVTAFSQFRLTWIAARRRLPLRSVTTVSGPQDASGVGQTIANEKPWGYEQGQQTELIELRGAASQQLQEQWFSKPEYAPTAGLHPNSLLLLGHCISSSSSSRTGGRHRELHTKEPDCEDNGPSACIARCRDKATGLTAEDCMFDARYGQMSVVVIQPTIQCWAERSPPCSAKVKNGRDIPPILHTSSRCGA